MFWCAADFSRRRRGTGGLVAQGVLSCLHGRMQEARRFVQLALATCLGLATTCCPSLYPDVGHVTWLACAHSKSMQPEHLLDQARVNI